MIKRLLFHRLEELMADFPASAIGLTEDLQKKRNAFRDLIFSQW